jgi:hypothetical protein
MGYYDLATGCQAVTTMPPGFYPSTNDGAAVDTRGASVAFFVVDCGTFSSTRTYDVKIQMATDAAFTTPVDITGATFTQYTTSNDDRVDVGRVNLRDCLRYVRAKGTDGGSGDVNLSCTVLLGVDNTADGGAVSDAGGQTAPYAAAFNLQPNDDGS